MRPFALNLLGFAFCVLLVFVAGVASRALDVPTVELVPRDTDVAASATPSLERVATQDTISAQPDQEYRARGRSPIPDDLPAGTPIAGQYIVVYKEDVTDAQAAASETSATAQAAVTAAIASNPDPAASTSSITSESATPAASPTVQVLSVTQAPPGVSSHALLKIPPGIDYESVITGIKQSDKVLTVVPNIVVSIRSRMLKQSAQATCLPAYYAAGVRVQYTPGLTVNWPNCLTGSDVALAVFGDRCGTNMDRFRWTGLYAYKPSTGQQVPGCVLLRSKTTDQAQLSKFFGSCGVSPTVFAGLPTNVCPERADSACVNAGSIGNYVVSTSRPLCADPRSNKAVLKGVSCGPNNALIQWNLMSATGCTTYSRTAIDEKQQSDWLGKCGVPPLQVTGIPMRVCGRVVPGTPPAPPPAPTPNPPPNPPPTPAPAPPAGAPGRLPSAPLASGERLDDWGMAEVGAYDSSAGTVVDARAAIASTGMKVGLIDTGAESTHPDLNIVEFVDFVDSPGSANYMKDGNGHGTHVAGIISAKNQGSGLFGVVPGMPILVMKTLGANGQGSLETVWQAYTEVLARLQKGERIVAINLSLGSSTTDVGTLQTECGYVSKIAAYGTAVAAAAGNDGAYLGGSIPASCSESMAVTSLTSSDTPSSFSNYAYSSTDQNKLNAMIAAPGQDIWSTYLNGGYQSLSGTSMATPFVTGAFAECFLAGYCKLGAAARTTNYPVVTGAAAKCGSSGLCGPSWGSSNYYGYLLNTRSWRV